MTRRRIVLALLGALALPVPVFAQAQKRWRIGILAVGVSSSEQIQMAKLHFAAILARFGYEEGRNVDYEWRFAEGDASRLPALAEDLVRAKVDLIIASFNPSVIAAKKATSTIPIVMLNSLSPVERGFVQSLARPGGNITGTAWSSPETMGKILQVMREAAPRAKRVAILGNAHFPGDQSYKQVSVDASAKLGMTLEFIHAARPEDIASALAQVTAVKADALFAALDSALVSGLREIADYARKRRIVSMSTVPQYVEAGGLLYYGPDLQELAERTLSYIPRILGGAKPAELPVELPTNYKLIVSKRAAKAIGYKIPRSLLERADQVVE
jgi:ABC-type uncharacterized transport system substrate-binding protein